MRFVLKQLFSLCSILATSQTYHSIIPFFNLPDVLVDLIGTYIDRYTMVAARCAAGQPVPAPWVLTNEESDQYLYDPAFRGFLHRCMDPAIISLPPQYFHKIPQLDLSGQALDDLAWLYPYLGLSSMNLT